MPILIDKKYNWQYIKDDFLECWYVGSERAVNQFLSYLNEHPDDGLDDLKRELLDLRGNFALIVQAGDRIIATVDKIRSYPVFYYHEGNRFQVSNSARALKDNLKLEEIDDLSLLEFRMAGFVTGQETLYTHLCQLQAGEVLIWDKDEENLERARYYLFYSENFRGEKEEDLIEELETITNRIFLRILEEAGDAPIWVPLSGGLDSRLVLCKLKELGCDNLTAFSYGPKGNYEAKAAREVAERVGIPWHFFPISMEGARVFFSTRVRKRYWEYSDGLCSVPNMQDLQVLHMIRREGGFPENGVIVNGQSGDFITGGHIPHALREGSPEVSHLLTWAVEKHYSQWKDLKSHENLTKVKAKTLGLLGIKERDSLGMQELSSRYECWEWQERQCKYVVNGQRIYDFLHLGWALPLWGDEYLDFWDKIPLKFKAGQGLYKVYLDRFDFFGCFRNFHPEIWRWPGVTIGVVPVARVIKALFGGRCSDLFYLYCKYIGHYRQFYAPYGLRTFFRKATRIRGPMSLNIERWISENMGENRVCHF